MSAPQHNTTDTKPLKRGRACLTCRFLKIKCDGEKPICGPCLKHPKDDECEYADTARRSRTKQLEDQVARLEARLRDLEQPEVPSPVVLRHPYDEPSQSMRATGIATSTSEAPWTSSPYSSVLTPPLDTPPGAPESSGRRTTSPQYNPDEPSLDIARSLIDTFLTYAPELGFFLNDSRFYSSVNQPLLFGHPNRPCSSVLSAVYLWGCHLSEQKSSEYGRWGNQRHYLNVALKYAVLGLSTDHPDKYIHTIQAEVLLAYYFLRLGNYLEARVHAGSALSISIGCGLHRIRSQHPFAAPVLSLTDDNIISLPAAMSAVEEGERIDAFWQVVILCKNLAVVLEAPTEVCGQLEAAGFQIDTPWPLNKKDYENLVLPQPSTATVNTFLRQTSHVDVSGSILALTAQATVLLQQVAFFSGQWVAGHRNAQFNFANTYQILNRLLGQFGHTLPALHAAQGPSEFFVHALMFAALIKLNEVAAQTEAQARHDCVKAAQSMIHWAYALLKDPAGTNPITGSLLTVSIRTLLDEIVRLRSAHPLIEESKEFTEEGIESTIRVGMQVLQYLSPDSPFMKHQLTVIQASYSSLR